MKKNGFMLLVVPALVLILIASGCEAGTAPLEDALATLAAQTPVATESLQASPSETTVQTPVATQELQMTQAPQDTRSPDATQPVAAPTVAATPKATAAATPKATATATPKATAAATPKAPATATPKATATATPKATATPTATPRATSASNLSYEEQVAELVNEIRAENGLGSLKLNANLSDVARAKSQDMHDNDYFAHESPTYGSPFEMMTAFGISYQTAGENIAMGYASPQAVVDAWMNSPGHRANILKASFTQIGVGYVKDGSYWTQMFIG